MQPVARELACGVGRDRRLRRRRRRQFFERNVSERGDAFLEHGERCREFRFRFFGACAERGIEQWFNVGVHHDLCYRFINYLRRLCISGNR